MNFKRIFTIFLCVFFAGFVFSQQKIQIKIGSICPANSPWENAQKKIAQEWMDISNGEVSVIFMNATAMGGERGVIQKMTMNIPGRKAPLDGGIFSNIGVYEFAPDSNVLTLCLPFMFENQKEISLVLGKTADHINSAVEAKGFKLLGWFNVGMAYFFTKEEVRSPDKLKQVSLSVGGITSPELGKAFQHAGYTTSDVPNEKILASLKSETGCGGLYTIPMYAYAAQYSKYAKYVLNMPICPVMAGFIINKQTWDSIPDKYKPAFIEIIRRGELDFINVQQNTDKEYLDKIVSEGGKLVNLTKAERQVFYDQMNTDAINMSKSQEIKVINYPFYQKIDAMIKSCRGR
ncbi:MAG: TRAP transporter substrate-binding protein DctP [Treponemataceae bacterium]